MSGSALRLWPTAAARAAIPRALPIAFAAAGATGLPLVLLYRLVLFHFYQRGAFLLDTGLLASLMWHDPAWLPLPPSLGGGSFFATHVAPLLSGLAMLSKLVPLSMPRWFAAFIGVSHALLAAGMLWLLAAGYGMGRGWCLVLSAVAAAGFACNGLALSIALVPHFELFGAACLLLSFIALALQRPGVAIPWFLVALATREDVGLHVFGFLTVWFAWDWWHGAAWRRVRPMLGFAFAGLAYSTAALLWQHWAFPGSSSFVRIYLGAPPFAHITAHLVAMRLVGWATFHPGILLPLLATLWWAARTRDASILLGYAACLPWALLHLLAVSDLAGLMAGYYAYPFLIALVWPWLMGVAHGQPAPMGHGNAWPAAAALGLVGLSLLVPAQAWNPGRIELMQAFLDASSARQQRLTDRAIAAVVASRQALGRVVVDESVAGLAPRDFSRGEIATWAKGPADTVVYLAEGYDATRLRATPGLGTHLAISGTMLRIRTDRSAQVLRDAGIVP